MAGAGLVARHAGSGIPAQHAAAITGLLQGLKHIRTVSAEGLVPLLGPVGIQFQRPVIGATKIGAGLVARHAGIGKTAWNVPAIACLLQAIEDFITAATEGLFPELVAIGVHLDDPVIKCAITGAGFAWRNAGGSRRAAQNVAAIAGLLQAIQVVIARAAERLLPNFIAAGVQLDDPVIKSAVTGAGFAWRNAGSRRPAAQDVTAIAGLLQGIQVVIARATEGFIPNFVAVPVQLDHPIIVTAIIGTGPEIGRAH